MRNVWPTRHNAVMALSKRLIKDFKENREEWRARRFGRFIQPLDAIVPVDPNHPSPAEINAAALRIAAQVDARHKKGVHQMAKRKTPQKTDKKYDRFVMDVREIGDPATSPSQAEINASVEINLRKQALAIFAKAEKAKTKGRKLTADDKQTYDHFAKQYPHLVPERRAELQKQLERFIQPAEGIRPNGVGPSPAEVDEAARRALENYKRSGKKSS